MAQPGQLPLYMRRERFDPTAELGESRRAEGIRLVDTPFGESVHLVTRYEDVRMVLADTTRFGNDRAAALAGPAVEYTEEEARMRAGQLLALDPPDHTRIRRLLTPEFTMRRMRRLEPRIVEIVDAALDDLENAGRPADLVAHFGLPVPSLVICELLGVPYADRAEFQRRSDQMLDLSATDQQRKVAEDEIRLYLAELIARTMAAPNDDLLGMLVREHGTELTADELVGIATILLIAGHETTANMLSLGTLALLTHPEQLAMVRDDPAAVEPAIDELLRWLSIVHAGVARVAKTDTEVAGRSVKAGELLLMSLPGANRDPALREDPDRFDITRGVSGHVAFGHGVHHCIGAPLARMELRIGFPALLRRFPKLALAVPFEEVGFRSNHAIFGVNSLPITW
ncbi:cytochrome P450 [Actinoalloteichus hymeniacidonis]|uniref:Cytochrome P450 n=1 Tax=Actinoalloteichus hymeniacidonis TaxID=340345 RepID=A0AAC9HME0_9PSEU|nr:cytochrome P450 [Actinoalloteichus hymeniacidonis]AOS62017.1 cytochrome P450 [Actinoalloteichus hymeniacidonis]MBB5909961.1 cytochrome P450 [Actinoalloteichus hymeniacidonis]